MRRAYRDLYCEGAETEEEHAYPRGPIYDDIWRLPLTWSSLEEKVLERLRPERTREDMSMMSPAGWSKKLIRAGRQSDGCRFGRPRHLVGGDRDLDVFLLFPTTLTREALEGEGLSLARLIAEKFSNSYQEKYAEHPYITRASKSRRRSRTLLRGIERDRDHKRGRSHPFHTRFIRER